MSYIRDVRQLPSSEQSDQTGNPKSFRPQGLCTCCTLCLERSHSGFAWLTLSLQSGFTLMSIFSEGFSPDSMEKGHSPSIVTFISSSCFIFPSHIPFLLLAVVYLLGAFTRARVLRLEKCLGGLRSAEVTSLNIEHRTSSLLDSCGDPTGGQALGQG